MSLPDDAATQWLARRSGLTEREACNWLHTCGRKYKSNLEVVLRMVNTYTEAHVPWEYVIEVTRFGHTEHTACHPVEDATGIIERYHAGILPLYVQHATTLRPRAVLRLALAGVPYEMVGYNERASDFASVLIMLYWTGVPAEYARPLFLAGYTVENVIGAWEASIPLEFAMEVDGGLVQGTGAKP